MADIEPPSFSLGLDLDFEPSHTHQNKQEEEEDNDEFRLRVSDSDLDSPEKSVPTRLRRLRRGGPTSNFVDDDIEDFSDEENVCRDDLLAPQHHSLCSSSKIPLSGRGVLMRQQESMLHNKKRKQDSNYPLSTSLDSSKGKSVFSDLTSSPLRRFQLLDSESDSDNPSEDVDIDRDASGVNFSKNSEIKEPKNGCRKIACEKNINSSASILQKQDLWKEFYADKSNSVPTPAFDEFCEEYFKPVKPNRIAPSCHELQFSEQQKSISKAKKIKQPEDLGSAVPPSHCYFFHDDLRIQKLVRSRLPHFWPLSVPGDTGDKPLNASAIDYMSQFGQDGAKQQAGRQVNVVNSSRTAGKKTKNFNRVDKSHSSGNWINPKPTANTPKDAGKRRVHADGRTAGHWFTAENGMKVYVTKSGQELTGQLAYRHYRKENGKGFKNSKKKRSSKKKVKS